MMKIRKVLIIKIVIFFTSLNLLFPNVSHGSNATPKENLRVRVDDPTDDIRMQKLLEELSLLKQDGSDSVGTNETSMELNNYTKLLFEDQKLLNLVDEYIPGQAQSFVKKDPFVASIVCSQVAGNLLNRDRTEDAEFIFSKVLKVLLILKNKISMSDEYLETGYAIDLHSRNSAKKYKYYEKLKNEYKLAEGYEAAIEEITNIIGLGSQDPDMKVFLAKTINEEFRNSLLFVTENAIRSEKSKSDYINIIKDVFGDGHINYLIKFGLLDEASEAIKTEEQNVSYLFSLDLARLKNLTSSKEITNQIDEKITDLLNEGGSANVFYKVPEIAYLLIKNSRENELEERSKKALELFGKSIDFAQSERKEHSTGYEDQIFYQFLETVYKFAKQAGVVDRLMQEYPELYKPKKENLPLVVNVSILYEKLRNTISEFSELTSHLNYQILSRAIQESVDYVLKLDNELESLKQILGSTNKAVRVSN